MRVLVILACVAGAFACSPAPSDEDVVARLHVLSEAPVGVEAAVLAAMPSAEIKSGGQQPAADGGEWEVTVINEGMEYELDLMPNGSGGFSVVQIQRDIAWEDAPENVRAAAAAAPGAFTPVRVIESREPVDGAVYYQLFSATDVAQHPSVQVRLLDGEAAVMPPAH